MISCLSDISQSEFLRRLTPPFIPPACLKGGAGLFFA
nr:MAG TPA: hypothetical protein [Bacteriophage sp.]